MKSHPVRVTWRLLVFFALILVFLLESLVRHGRPGNNRAYKDRAGWLGRLSRRLLRAFNIQFECRGSPPSSGVLVSNHLSYLDIPVLAAQAPMVFVAKMEIRGWPVIGWCVQCAGSLFVDRNKRSDVARVGQEFESVINDGALLGLFPEGTSSGGHEILPFHSSLLAPAEEHRWPVTAVCIGYSVADGSVEDEICYWRDMTFFPHFLNLLSKKEIRAVVVYGEPLAPGLDRKEMARQLREQICQMRLIEPN